MSMGTCSFHKAFLPKWRRKGAYSRKFYSLSSTLRLNEGDDGDIDDDEGRSWDKDDDNDVARLQVVVAAIRPKPLVLRWLKTEKSEESRYASSTSFLLLFYFFLFIFFFSRVWAEECRRGGLRFCWLGLWGWRWIRWIKVWVWVVRAFEGWDWVWLISILGIFLGFKTMMGSEVYGHWGI